MISAKSLALYKNRPVVVLEARDKLEIRLEDGSTLKVRDKDLEALHPGPLTSMPEAAAGGDFDTARAMAEPGLLLAWSEVADLVFGHSGPAEVLACWKEGLDGGRFKAQTGGLVPLSDEEVAKEAEKRAKKEGEASLRAGFLERAKAAKAGRSGTGGGPFIAGDERFLAEIEAFALGKSQKSKLAAEIGFAESSEAAHAFLLKAGVWADSVNPWPSRAGCSLGPPKVSLEADRRAIPREDLCGIQSWAIDNAWSHDPDDAVAYADGWVYVHVADPAAAIRPGDEADREAMGRGSTLYLPESINPMLPDEALERFGLGLSATSPALTFRFRLDAEGAIAETGILASTVKVRRSHYEEADRLIAAGEAPELAALASIAAIRRERRVAQGAIEIDIPEVRVHVRDGTVTIDSLPETKASGMVRELMLLAGEGVARWAFDQSLPFPYYSQEAPGEAGAAAEGEGLSAQFARRRLMRGGITGPSPAAHRGLGLPFYAQATSPLRRYQDLLGHMQIRALLEGREPLASDEVMRRCAEAQAGSAATRQAERSSELHWTLAWLLRNPGWEGEGVVVGGGGQGNWQVYLPALGLETRLKLGPGHAPDETLRLKVARVDLAGLESSFDMA
jgi:exoribonuclease-2